MKKQKFLRWPCSPATGTRPGGWHQWLVVIGVGLSLFLGGLSLGTALAHGKDIALEVATFTPDPQQPLTRLYRVFVSYSDDKEGVREAVVYLSGQRRHGGEVLAPVRLEPLNVAGFYVCQITFSRYGTWEVSLEVKDPGEGGIRFVEEVLPAALVRETEATGEPSQISIARLSLGFTWRDVANVGVRWVHSLSALIWFGLSGLIVAAFGLLKDEPRARLLSRLSRLFPPVAAVSLALLAGTGIYNAIYNSPIRPPGVFSLEAMERTPYGTAYLAAVGAKALALAVMVGLAHGMARSLRLLDLTMIGARQEFAPADIAVLVASKARPAFPLAAFNLGLGLTLLLGVAVLGYLHNLSHLALSVQGGR